MKRAPHTPGSLFVSLAIVVIGVASAVGASGCTDLSDRNRVCYTIDVRDGGCDMLTEGRGDLSCQSFEDGVWESAPFPEAGMEGCPWIPLPPRAPVILPHPLGRTPRAVLVYLSFVESGESSALAAGDLAQIVEATDAQLTVKNETSQPYFARVVAY